jgi:hypothetical protein
MEIHKPHAVHSPRDFAIELGTITAGVLIALSLEGLVTWQENRTLVREARETMALELGLNNKELVGELASIDARRKDLDDAVRMADDALAKRKATVERLNLGLQLADLQETAWQSAAHTGALSHMNDADVQTYASVYSLQELFTQEQRGVLDELTAALSIFGNGDADPTLAPVGDLERFREAVMLLRARLLVHKQLGEKLAEHYSQALAGSSR